MISTLFNEMPDKACGWDQNRTLLPNETTDFDTRPVVFLLPENSLFQGLFAFCGKIKKTAVIFFTAVFLLFREVLLCFKF